MVDETERVRRIWDRHAAAFDRQIRFWERALFAGGRDWVGSRARGKVLEIGVGTGRNLSHYRDGVELTGIDLSPLMLEIARRRARELGLKADLAVGDAQHLDFPDGSFDTVVSTLTLCTVPDDRRAVAEAKRVLGPGGRFLLLEHTAGSARPVRALQRLADPLALRAAGDHLLREPLEHLAAEGFVVEELERSRWGIVERVSARRPGPPLGEP